MKLLIILLLLVSLTAQSAKKTKPVSYDKKVYAVSENILIGPQPMYGDFETLKNMGIVSVINSRTKTEMDELKFKEDYLLDKNDINYAVVSVGGEISYSPEKLAEFDKAISKVAGGKILLHCRSGHRSSQLYAAWLVKYKGMNPNDALKVVKPSGWWPMPMEALLGKELVISIAD